MKAASAALLLAWAATVGAAGAQPASPAPAAPVAIVHIKAFAYSPATVTVKTGESVQFVNDDDAAHTATATDSSFDSGYLAKGDRWTATFSKPGEFAYLCTYHPFMKGSVTVRTP